MARLFLFLSLVIIYENDDFFLVGIYKNVFSVANVLKKHTLNDIIVHA